MRIRNCSLFILAVFWWSGIPVFAAYFPENNESWETVNWEDAGVNAEQLQEAIDYAETTHGNALVILYRGRILVEQYWNDWGRDTRGPAYSSTKSIASVLVGQAIEEGLIEGQDQAAADFLREWQDEPGKQDILIRHHLSMTTGFEESPTTLLRLQQAVSERRFGTQQLDAYPPGTRWYYNDAAYRLLFYILEEASDMSLPEYSASRLFEPLGMNETDWVIREETLLGRTIDNYEWVEFSALDAARFGWMAFNKGNWNGNQVVPESWMNASIVSQYEHAPWYGRLWWLNASSIHKTPSVEIPRSGSIAPDAPKDMFAALGAFDQKIYVIPSMDIVVVRLGGEALDSRLAAGVFDNLLLGRICRAFGYTGQEQSLDLRLHRIDDQVDLEYDTWNGRSYLLSTSPDLVNWAPLDEGDATLGDGDPVSILQVLEGNAFYRLQSWFEGVVDGE